jgi:hypothetical protein
MKKLFFCVISLMSFNVVAAEAGPVTIGVCPTCPTKAKPAKPKPTKPKTNKPKPCPTTKPCEKCEQCEKCEKCEPEVRTVTIEKTVYAPAKKNTLSLLIGQDYNGLDWDRKGSNVQLHRRYGWVSGIRYERHLDETWSVSGEYLTNESGNLGVGLSW